MLFKVLDPFTVKATILFAILNALNVCLTAGVLAFSGIEVVPMSACLIETVGYNGLLIFKLSLGTALMVVLCERDWKRISGRRVAVALNIAFGLIVAWNLFGFIGQIIVGV